MYDHRDARGNQIASRTSESFPDQWRAVGYRDITPDFHRGIVQEVPPPNLD